VRAWAPYTFTAGRRGPGGTGASFIEISLRSRPGLVPLTHEAMLCQFAQGEAKPMNTMTVRALMLGLVIALWAWVADAARLHVSLWAGVVALGCFYAAGGGVPGLQKTIVAALSGVVWVLIYHAVRVAIGARGLVGPVLLGALACALALQSRVPFLSLTAAAFAGAGVALGLGVNTLNEAIRAGVALAVGAAVGFAAERGAGM